MGWVSDLRRQGGRWGRLYKCNGSQVTVTLPIELTRTGVAEGREIRRTPWRTTWWGTSRGSIVTASVWLVIIIVVWPIVRSLSWRRFTRCQVLRRSFLAQK